ncbi:MAG: hypothetical protein IH901_08045, partial [Proteobacteria bacterium]|nr:hypothetical protein [Pseudomonadota bacterium]
MSILEKLRPHVDETVGRLIETEFRIDPIAGERFSKIPSIIGSVQKRHGTIIEMALREAINLNEHITVWKEDEFKVSSDAVGIVAGVNNVKLNPDWLHILTQQLTYGGASKSLQVDLIAYNHDTREIKALEVKRGNSHHDAGKKKAILKDVLCVQMLLKSYGEQEGFEV